MKIKREIYDRILNSCPTVPPETGGILGGCNGVIAFAEFDFGTIENNFAVYIPNIKKLNGVIAEWNDTGIGFSGMFHSHPKGQETLSNDDIKYINSIFDSMPDFVTELYFPIVIPNLHIVSYKAIKTNHRLYIERDKIDTVK